MAKLRVVSGADVCKILERHGFHQVRQHGSHVVMQLKTGSTTVTVPDPNLRELRSGTLFSIIRQSGLPRSEFE
ncbi:MAG: type II toxin-antitoxin system HicA family toxin [Planctomycetia bacterium]|nr:type II toxin-antitoxin system HicA family toxin [Planctomycetia bacterium]